MHSSYSEESLGLDELRTQYAFLVTMVQNQERRICELERHARQFDEKPHSERDWS